MSELRGERSSGPSEILDEIEKKVLVLKLAANDPGLTHNELTLRTLDSIYMDYFSYSEAYLDLLEQGFLMESVRKGEERLDAKGQSLRSVDVTPEGFKVLTALYPQLPLPVRTYLEESEAARSSAHAKSYVPAAHRQTTEDGRVRCYLALREGQGAEIFSLAIVVPSEKLGQEICRSFLDRPEEIYLTVLKHWQDDTQRL